VPWRRADRGLRARGQRRRLDEPDRDGGANGGSFSATLNAKGPAVFVVQSAGDSGRIGEGTPALVVKVTK
jgi:hypothetical protein